MRLSQVAFLALVAIPLASSVGCSESSNSGTGGTGGSPAASYAGNLCVGTKQALAGTFCKTMFDTLATWETAQDDSARDSAIETARMTLGRAWDGAESNAELAGANCADLALPSSQAADDIEAWGSSIVSSINAGLDLGQSAQAQCGASLLTAAGDACEQVLAAESVHISDLAADTDGSVLDAAKSAAFDAFVSAWADATSGDCPSNATDDEVSNDLQSLTAELVLHTIVTPLLDDQAFTTLTPGPTDYLGRTYNPQCMQGSEYVYFAKRGTVNKLVMYYQGGGACWSNLTCGVPTCSTTSTEDDNPNGTTTGFGDLSNENNPFRDWNIVFVSYCTCDIHFGDATVVYPGPAPLTVHHVGYQNSKVAERWAREHFVNPDEVFVVGSSAGAYGAWFNAPLLEEVWPASQFQVLADAGNGVITQDFLDNEFSNWNFVANLPDIPGVVEAITEGSGIPGYTEAVATHFPNTNWAHYATMFDGGEGGQTGFYNIMLSGGNPLAALVWWNASCAWGSTALSQSQQITSAVPSNYRFYFGTGSRHTMWGSDKVYDDTTGGVPTIVDWVNAMLASGPDGRDADWTNVLCEDCGLLLDGDPRPDPAQAPFEEQGADVRVVCE
jgi:hypothetical protein